MADLDERLGNYRATLDDAIEAERSRRDENLLPTVPHRTARRRTRYSMLLVAACVALVAGGLAAYPRTSLERPDGSDTGPRPQTDEAPPPSDHVVTATEAPGEVAPDSGRPSLRFGDEGDDVAVLQTKLRGFGFDVGPVDSVFGERTRSAVWAFETLVLGSRPATGVVSSEVWRALDTDVSIAPRRPELGRHIEVYLPEQVLAVFDDGRAQLVTHISSGSGEQWCGRVTIDPGNFDNRSEEPITRDECGRAYTPGGVFVVAEILSGTLETGIGTMQSPIFFNYAIAIHGADDVPLEPVSHGGVRVLVDTIEDMHPLVSVGDPVYVWDGIAQPEDNGRQVPFFNWLDPARTTDDEQRQPTGD